jgi:glycosyltransferase involved in cell wall biosynthesis
MKKISIVIPVYNEERTLDSILKKLFDLNLPGYEKEIIVVDDGSTDGTKEILTNYKNRLKVHNHQKNSGKGTAVKSGLELATGDLAVIQDADLEYDPQELPNLLKLLRDEKTLVFGSRNLHHEPRRNFIVQRAGVWFLTKLINSLYGTKLTDVWTCYKIFPTKIKHYFVAGKFDSEILFTLNALHHGYKIKEGPISHRPRSRLEGKKIKISDGISAILKTVLHKLSHMKKVEATVGVRETLNIIVDPISKKPLRREGKFLVSDTGAKYRLDEHNRPFLIEAESYQLNSEEHMSGINWLKSFFKQWPWLYYTIWHSFCPVLMLVNGPRKIKNYLDKDQFIVDIGSGPERLGKEFINVDVFPFPEVDIVADASVLPFADNSIPAMVSESMLEHVAEANSVAKEMVRSLKPGGYLYVSVPFIHPYHASPDDFNRWTLSGLKYMFKELQIVEAGVRSGPWSAVIMFMAYWLGVLLSFGNRKIAPFISHFLMLFMGPFKFLDFLFYWIPGSDAVATHVYIIAKK